MFGNRFRAPVGAVSFLRRLHQGSSGSVCLVGGAGGLGAGGGREVWEFRRRAHALAVELKREGRGWRATAFPEGRLRAQLEHN